MNDELEIAINTMQQMLVGVSIQETTKAYDAYASQAMEVLLKKVDVPVMTDIVAEAIASTAWTIADAMMAERKKRGLGGFEESKEG